MAAAVIVFPPEPTVCPRRHLSRGPAETAQHRVVVELDADGNALNDLGEVAGRVLGRDHAEDRAGRGGHGENMAAKDVVRQDIGDDRRRLSRRHMLELAFLEVGVHPEVMRRDDGDEIGAACDIGADLSGAIADIAVDRRANIGVAEVELGRVEIGLGLGDVGLGDGDLRVQNRQLLLRGVEPGRGRDHAGFSREVQRRRALRVLPRSGGGLRKVAIPLVVLLGERRLRILGVEVRLRLADGRLLHRLFALEAVEGRLARLDNRGRAVGGGAKIAVVETDQRLSRAHIFVVANEDLAPRSPPHAAISA